MGWGGFMEERISFRVGGGAYDGSVLGSYKADKMI